MLLLWGDQALRPALCPLCPGRWGQGPSRAGRGSAPALVPDGASNLVEVSYRVEASYQVETSYQQRLVIR